MAPPIINITVLAISNAYSNVTMIINDLAASTTPEDRISGRTIMGLVVSVSFLGAVVYACAYVGRKKDTGRLGSRRFGPVALPMPRPNWTRSSSLDLRRFDSWHYRVPAHTDPLPAYRDAATDPIPESTELASRTAEPIVNAPTADLSANASPTPAPPKYTAAPLAPLPPAYMPGDAGPGPSMDRQSRTRFASHNQVGLSI